MNAHPATPMHPRVSIIASGGDKLTEDRVSLALEEYAAAMEAGQPISKESLLTKYADVAEELAGCLDSLDFIRQVAPQLNDQALRNGKDDGAAIRPLATLGDFRIVREIGRGGMGVVYEAEQLSLGRRVALKVLPFAAMLGDQQLKRFHNEARAAATLDHPNIVAIHSVGTERGVHYYAMQLVEGRNLAQVIAELQGRSGVEEQASRVVEEQRSSGVDEQTTDYSNTPPLHSRTSADTSPIAALSTLPDFDSREFFQAVARLGLQAAEALDYAHQQGVIHRDVKPANLLVDASGKLWVTDFGLARVEADAGMTMTGDLIGTLRYMSPEQTLANRITVDHRTDVYSLGATLYELLALRPSYTGRDRQELLKQIAFEDPPKLRQLNPRIPVDVQTIIAKAMEKTPEDRYATAKELAADLRALLESRPIAAQPATLQQRITKWSRRHAGLAAAVASIALLFLGVTIAGLIALGQAWSEARDAQLETAKQRDRYLGERDQALHNLYIADVRLAHQEWDDGHLATFDKLLNAHIPRAGEPDSRGWEWYYLKSLGQRDVATLEGHMSGVRAVSWSPDGRWLASGSADNTIRIWDSQTYTIKSICRGDSNAIRSIAWSPDSSRIATTSADNRVRIWSLSSEVPEVTMSKAFDSRVQNVVWSPDGTMIAACGSASPYPYTGDGITKIWDATSGAELRQLAGPHGLVWAVAWSPDGKRIVTTGNYDAPEMKVWGANTGELLRRVPTLPGYAVTSPTWSPNSKFLAAAQSRDVFVWDSDDWTVHARFSAHSGATTSLAWHPEGELLATVGDGTVKIWNQQSELVNVLRGHRETVRSVAWRPHGGRLASASDDRTIRIWEPTRDQLATKLYCLGMARWYNNDGRALTMIRDDAATGKLRLDKLEGGSWKPILQQTLQISRSDVPNTYSSDLACSPDGLRFAFGRGVGNKVVVSIVERDTGTTLLTLEKEYDTPVDFEDMAWSPDGQFLAIALGWVGALVWDVSSSNLVAELKLRDQGEGIDSVSWNPDGTQLAISSWDQRIGVFEAGSWREVAKLNRHPAESEQLYGGDQMVTWNHDGTLLAAGTSSGWLIVWNASTWRETMSFSAHTAPIRSIAFSPDGRRMVTAGRDRRVKVWEMSQGQHLLTLQAPVIRVEFSPDGTCLLAAADDIATIWDASPAMERVRQ